MGLVEPGTTVFIIDDDLIVRQSLEDVLVMEGYETRSMASADAAWREIVAGARPAAIILDLWLAGMSSGEFVRRLRSSEHAGIGLLLLSGSRSVVHYELDVDAVCVKDVETTTLVQAVDKIVRSRAREQSALQSRRARRPQAIRSRSAAYRFSNPR